MVKLGELNYDHVLILPPAKAKGKISRSLHTTYAHSNPGLGPALAPKALLEFVNKQGNILLALTGSSAVPAALASLLLEFNIQLPADRSSLTLDHFNYDTTSAAEKHDVLVLPAPSPIRPDVADLFATSGVIAFPHALGQALGNSPLLAPILRAPETAYTYNPKEETEVLEDPFATGNQISLVSTLQAHNSARFTVFGSVEALQDEWFKAKVKTVGGEKISTANREFAQKVTAWTFQESGVLKVGHVQHHLAEDSVARTSAYNRSLSQPGSLNPTIYRVKNDVTFSVEISEWNGDRWAPFVVPSQDALQLEFTMLSPFHRLALEPAAKTANSTFFSKSFTTPDQHGIFSFRVNYRRPYLTNIEVKEEVTVRHFAHDEWPRSYAISGAWPWISGIWVTIAGWVVFVALWLYSAPAKDKSVKKTQ